MKFSPSKMSSTDRATKNKYVSSTRAIPKKATERRFEKGKVRTHVKCSGIRWKRTLFLFAFLVFVFKWYSWATEGMRIGLLTIKAEEASLVQTNPCLQETQTPKVALMFLTTRVLHNEPVWRAFFEAAGKLCFLPVSPMNTATTSSPLLDPYSEAAGSQTNQNTSRDQTTRKLMERKLDETSPYHSERGWNCSQEDEMINPEVERLMSESFGMKNPIESQHLFSVYVNSRAYQNSSVTSIFSQYVTKNLIDTDNSFAQFTLVSASIQLLRTALHDPLNTKFILLSESCVPIRPPEVIHAQLIAEKRSRLNACTKLRSDLGRWNWHIVEKQYWRKSSQFFCLKRSHAQLVVHDRELKSKFQEYCYTDFVHRRICVADEHYFGTLLAYHGLENQTDCRGYITSSEWDGRRSKWHPVSYDPSEVNTDLLKRLAGNGLRGENCTVEETKASTGSIYNGFSGAGCTRRDFISQKQTGKHWVVNFGYKPLYYPCPMFSRKFTPEAVKKTLQAALSCHGTGLGYWCY